VLESQELSTPGSKESSAWKPRVESPRSMESSVFGSLESSEIGAWRRVLLRI